MWNYVPSIATAFLAFLQLAKDWERHQTTWRRALVLILIILLGVGGAISTYYANARSEAQYAEDQKEIRELKKVVETATAHQEATTRQSAQSFDLLRAKLDDLKSNVNTSVLQKEAAQLKAELEATQKALSPPKAELVASLGEVSETRENTGVKQVSARREPDGTVQVTVKVVNKSAVQAKTGFIFLRLCETCQFAEEPERFVRPVGASDYDRQMSFQAISATALIAVPLKIKPPAGMHRLAIGVTTRCENCTVRGTERLVVNY